MAKIKKNKNTPPVGIVYLLQESLDSYWIAVDYITLERIGPCLNTRFLHNIPKYQANEYVASGLILYTKIG